TPWASSPKTRHAGSPARTSRSTAGNTWVGNCRAQPLPSGSGCGSYQVRHGCRTGSDAGTPACLAHAPPALPLPPAAAGAYQVKYAEALAFASPVHGGSSPAGVKGAAFDLQGARNAKAAAPIAAQHRQLVRRVTFC